MESAGGVVDGVVAVGSSLGFAAREMGNSSAMGQCKRCDGPLVEVPMVVSGAELTMSSCNRCDQRTWERNGEVVDLTEVLDLTASTSANSRRNTPQKG